MTTIGLLTETFYRDHTTHPTHLGVSFAFIWNFTRAWALNEGAFLERR